MTQIVVDASITGAIILNELSDLAGTAILATLGDAELLLPAHWQLEVASLLVKAARRLRMKPEDYEKSLLRVELLLASASIQSAVSTRTIFGLAFATGLTAYDATYLELAERFGAILASSDGPLIEAARAREVRIITARP